MCSCFSFIILRTRQAVNAMLSFDTKAAMAEGLRVGNWGDIYNEVNTYITDLFTAYYDGCTL